MSYNWKAICSDKTQQIVYACSYNEGIYKSTDGGESFEYTYKFDSTTIKYLNISCDNTGDYFICGCTESYIICSLDGGETIKFRQLSSPSYYQITEVQTKPNIEKDNYNVAIFICASRGGPFILYIYEDLTFFKQENLNYRLASLCLTNNYIITLGIDDATIRTYDYPQKKNVSIGGKENPPICETSGLNYAGGYIRCNENYVCYFGITVESAYMIWVMKILELSNKIEIPSSTGYQCLTISESGCVYENIYTSSSNLRILKYLNLDFSEKNYDTAEIFTTTENPTMTIIYTNPYNIVNSETQPLLIANNKNGIYYSFYSGEFNTLNFSESNISCFLENTKIRILKNNEAYDEFIQNLKLEDDIIISNGETRKLKFIGYNFIGVNKIKNIAKIKKDAFGLNKPCQDLYVITGHSLLFKEIPDNIKNEYYDETIYNTTVYDDYKKIIVLHTNIYETPTLEELNVINYKIKYFHIALENENKDEHYAIYSNNILTETMTLNYANKSNLIPL